MNQRIDRYVYRTTSKFPLVDGHWFYGDLDVSDREKLVPGDALCYSEDGKNHILFFFCPCGCGDVCEIPVGAGSNGWSLTIDKNGPTLSPSVSCIGQACKSHFFMRDGSIVWC